MGGELKPGKVLAKGTACVLLAAVCVSAQTPKKHHVAQVRESVSPVIVQAETAIDKRDYSEAEKLLLPVVSTDPHDYRAWFDLGYVYTATQRRAAAIDAYRKSVNAKPEIYETNLDLGLQLGLDGQNNEAAKYLQAALKLMPESTPAASRTSFWMAFGRVQEKADPDSAIRSFRKAAEITPQYPEAHLNIAQLLENKKDLAGAESEYKATLSLDPQSRVAISGLARIYLAQGRTREYESILRDYVAKYPGDAAGHMQLGQLLLKSGDTNGALEQLNQGLSQSPQDEQLLHVVAALYAANKKFEPAAARYSDLVHVAPENADYRYEYGVVLMQQHQFAQAQDQLIAALQRNAKMTDAYGDLAVAASENKNFPLAIQVLDTRAKLTPETPATYFLRATAYDSLKAFDKASENYRQFLAVDNGQFPDKEWQARHRLIAIEPDHKKRKH